MGNKKKSKRDVKKGAPKKKTGHLGKKSNKNFQSKNESQTDNNASKEKKANPFSVLQNRRKGTILGERVKGAHRDVEKTRKMQSDNRASNIM